MFAAIYRTFLKGLLALAPLVATLAIVIWIGSYLRGFFDWVGRLILPDGAVGAVSFIAGAVATVTVIFVAGVLLNIYFVEATWNWFTGLMDRLPLVKTIYGSIRDMAALFNKSDKEKKESQVVMVELAPGARLIGFVTRDKWEGLPQGLTAGDDDVAVYMPMSYQLGGFMMIVPRSTLHPVNMSMDEALSFALTAGVTTKKSSKTKAASDTEAALPPPREE